MSEHMPTLVNLSSFSAKTAQIGWSQKWIWRGWMRIEVTQDASTAPRKQFWRPRFWHLLPYADVHPRSKSSARIPSTFA